MFIDTFRRVTDGRDGREVVEATMRVLVAIPVYNEQAHVRAVLDRVLRHVQRVLVIDDGSTDGTPRLLADYPIDVIRHARNLGYGRSLRDAFRWAAWERYDWLITMDCDEQHEPDEIPAFLDAAFHASRLGDADIISGSRYLLPPRAGEGPPADRRAINRAVTDELNARLGLSLGTELTDAFCGFKAYRVEKLRHLRPSVPGYAMPVQLWVQAAAAGLTVRELPVKLIYNDPNRSFGATLDDPEVRLRHYRCVLHRELKRQAARLPGPSTLRLEPCGD